MLLLLQHRLELDLIFFSSISVFLSIFFCRCCHIEILNKVVFVFITKATAQLFASSSIFRVHAILTSSKEE
jgi:hypothetical protein